MCHGREVIEFGINIVQSGQNEDHHEPLEDRLQETAADATYLSQSAKTSGSDFDYVIIHKKFLV
jgi:hypothetical protein